MNLKLLFPGAIENVFYGKGFIAFFYSRSVR